MLISFELKMLFRNPFAWVLTGLLFIFLLFGTYYGTQRVEKQKTTIAEVQTKAEKFYQEKKLLLDSIEKGWREPEKSWYKDPANPLPMGTFRGAGWYVVLQPAPLAVVSTGQSDIFPFYSKVAVGNTNAGSDNDHFENPFSTAIGQFDLAFVLTFIFPLLIIAFTYNLLSAEREQGILRLLLSMPLSVRTWLFQKLTFRYVFLLLLSIILLAMSLGIFGVSITNFSFLQLSAALGFYALFWFLVAFSVNLLEKSSAVNAMILLGVWLFFTLLVPSVASMLSSTLYPVPSRVGFVTAQRDAESEAEKKHEEIINNFYAKNPQFLKPANEKEQTWRTRWLERFAEKEYSEKIVGKIRIDFEEKAQAQRHFADNFQWFSPAIFFQNTLSRLAKTDTETYLDFQVRTAEFEKKWTTFFKGKFLKDEKLKTADYDNLPKWEYVQN